MGEVESVPLKFRFFPHLDATPGWGRTAARGTRQSGAGERFGTTASAPPGDAGGSDAADGQRPSPCPAQLRDQAAQWSQDWSELAVDVPGLTATFSFDRYGRVQRIDGSIGAAP